MIEKALRAWYSLIRLGFRLLYHEFAFTYDWVSYGVSMGAWRCWGRAALKHLNAARGALILEIAHGTGHLYLDLYAMGFCVYGLDLSPQMGAIARRRLRAAGISPRLLRAKAQALPFPTERFAAVVSTFPADFILASETLTEVWRVLRPGGRFVVVPNAVFTSRDVGAKSLEVLYRITGQRADPKAAEHLFSGVAAFFERFGFQVSIHQEACPRSSVTVIVAEKVSAAPRA